MKMPGKIYIPGKWLCIPKNFFETEDSPGATEYIRKDALLEWAKEHQEKERQNSLIWACYQIFIDEINSL